MIEAKPMTDADWDKLHKWMHARWKRADYAKKNPLSVRLQKKLVRMGYKVDVPRRTNASWAWKSSGSWAWSAWILNEEGKPSGVEIGCSDTMRSCLKMTDEELEKNLE